MTFVSGTDRGHLPIEHLDPSLQSFAATGASTLGSLGGNVSAQSLAQAPVPAALATGGATACTADYSSGTNSLLDVIVGGCKWGIVQLVNASQPDQSDPDVPAAGAGGPYKLTASNAATHVVDTCKDKNNATVDPATCLNAAAYSFYFKFSTDRVIAKAASAADVIYHDDFDEFP